MVLLRKAKVPRAAEALNMETEPDELIKLVKTPKKDKLAKKATPKSVRKSKRLQLKQSEGKIPEKETGLSEDFQSQEVEPKKKVKSAKKSARKLKKSAKEEVETKHAEEDEEKDTSFSELQVPAKRHKLASDFEDPKDEDDGCQNGEVHHDTNADQDKNIVNDANEYAVHEDNNGQDLQAKDETAEAMARKKRKHPPSTETPAKLTKFSNLKTCVFSNLPPEMTQQLFIRFLLQKDFKAIHCRFSADAKRAYVDVDSDDAGQALSLNDSMWHGTKLLVKLDAKHLPSTKGYTESSEVNRRTLFCSRLPYDASEDDVAELFDGVKSVRIVKRKDNEESKGCAFIEFETDELRDAAVDKKDGIVLQKRLLRIEPFKEQTKTAKRIHDGKARLQIKKNPQIRRINSSEVNRRTLICSELPNDASEDDVAELFDGVNSVRIVKRKGKSKRCAFIEFETDELRDAAVDKKDGIVLQKQLLRIQPCTNRTKAEKRLEIEKNAQKQRIEASAKKLFLKGITKDMDKASILEHFKGAVHVKNRRNNKRVNDFGFVEYRTIQEAKQAFETYKNGVEINGITLAVKLAVRKEPGPPTTILYVNGLTEEMDESSLLGCFEKAVGAKIPMDFDTGKSKRYGFVKFDSAEDTKTARANAKKSVTINGKNLAVDFGTLKSYDAIKGTKSKVLSIKGVTEDMESSAILNAIDDACDVAIGAEVIGQHKPFGFVVFDSKENALDAYRKNTKGIMVNGKTLTLHLPHELHKNESPTNPSKKLRISGLTDDITEQDIKTSFKDAIKVVLPQDEKTGKKKSHAFIHFKTLETSVNVYNKLKGGLEIKGKKLQIRYKNPVVRSKKDTGKKPSE